MTTFLIILTSGQFPPRINDIQENWESIGNNSILDSFENDISMNRPEFFIIRRNIQIKTKFSNNNILEIGINFI